MSNRITIMIAVASGLFGSAVMRYIAPPVAHAQDPAAVKEVRAESVALVDPANHIVGVFTTESVDQNGITGTGPNGLSVSAFPRHVVLKDFKGRTIWSPDSRIKVMPLTMK